MVMFTCWQRWSPEVTKLRLWWKALFHPFFFFRNWSSEALIDALPWRLVLFCCLVCFLRWEGLIYSLNSRCFHWTLCVLVPNSSQVFVLAKRNLDRREVECMSSWSQKVVQFVFKDFWTRWRWLFKRPFQDWKVSNSCCQAAGNSRRTSKKVRAES